MSTPSIPQPQGYQQDGGQASGEATARDPGAPAPLLDASVLRDMEQDFTDAGVVARFAQDFSVSLGEKIDRLDRRLQDGDASGAHDAAISLSTSADMVGAERLGEAARAVRDSLTDADAGVIGGARGMVEGLRACASETLRELELAYPRSA